MLPQRQFGGSCERTTVLGLGGGALSRRSNADGVVTVRRAVELGIRYFDTSPHYCRNESQPIIAAGLEKNESPVMLATKLGHFDDPSAYRSRAALLAQLEDNLRRLRRDSVDVLQVHEADWACWWVSDASPGQLLRPEQARSIADAPVLQVLRQAKKDGLCRYVGITGNNADHLAYVLAQADVDAVLVAFNYDLLFRGARRNVLPLAKQKGVTFIAAAVLHGSLLTDSPSDAHPGLSAVVQERLDRLRIVASSARTPLSELAIRYLLADDRISVILVGAASSSEIEQAVRAVQAGPLPRDVHEALDALGLDEELTSKFANRHQQ